ncbi:MAG: glutathione S-transferase family protein [Pseudomonadota bacterium]
MRVLYHWPLDPGSRQVRLALAEKGLKFDLQHVSPFEEDLELLTLNPAGLPPVLVEDRPQAEGGRAVIVETRAILEYLDDTQPDTALLPSDPIERAEVRRLASWFDRKFEAEVNAYLLAEKLEKRLAGGGSPDMAAIREGRDFLRWHCGYLNGLLEAREGLAGPRFTLADIAAAAHLSAIDYLGDIGWEHYPALKAWYERVKCRPAFRPLLKDRLPGVPPARWYAALDF